MPRIHEDPPHRVLIERDGLEFSVGTEADFSWDELRALWLQLRRQRLHRDITATKLSRDHVEALINAKRILGGTMEDWSK